MTTADPKLAARLARMTSEQKLDAVLTMLVRLERKLDGRAASPESTVASEAELDSRQGDEEVKKDPKRWQGDSFAGKRMSECSPDYLDAVADFCEWAIGTSEAKAKVMETKGDHVGAAKERVSARYRRATWRRARGWAARLRAGWQRPGSAPESTKQDEENW